jgi:hypothetical protein
MNFSLSLHLNFIHKSKEKKDMKRVIVSFVFLGILFHAAKAQIGTDELPYSWGKGVGVSMKSIPVVTLSSLDMVAISKEDSISESSGPYPVRFGFPQKVNLSLSNSGVWKTTADGGRLWAMKIYSPNALSLNLLYDQFWLPEGARFYVYSEDMKQHLGAFTSKNNKGSKDDNLGFATGLLFTNSIVLEYYQPASASDNGVISIAQVVSGYRYIYDIVGNEIRPKDRLLCHNDVNSVEGDGWQREKNAVAYMVMGGHICTGSLLNTTANDNRPVFLTAEHCFSSSADVSQWIFYWNYEAPAAGETAKPVANQSTSGAQLLAKREDTGFMLLDLIENPAMSPNIMPYYLGWDRTATGGASGAVIHHPKGAQKKISLIDNAIVSNPANICWGLNCSQGSSPANTHWRATFTNGTGEKGSAGSPLFNQSRRVMGQMHGGAIICPPHAQFFFGRFDVSWEGASNRERLQDWLDPAGTVPPTIDGMEALPVIIGADLVCETGETFKLNNRSLSYDWRVSEGFEIMPNGNSAKVVATATNGQNGVVTAVVNGKTVAKKITACQIHQPEENIIADGSGKAETKVIANWTIVVYPNPTADGLLQIDISGDAIPRGALIEIYSAGGYLVRKLTNVSTTNAVNIASQPAGVYTMRIIFDKENLIVWKVIKD